MAKGSAPGDILPVKLQSGLTVDAVRLNVRQFRDFVAKLNQVRESAEAGSVGVDAIDQAIQAAEMVVHINGQGDPLDWMTAEDLMEFLFQYQTGLAGPDPDEKKGSGSPAQSDSGNSVETAAATAKT
tara:strand:+ start:9406 stop:9786 length:381 start_codon:yes stop_codon:yes gene_type:complete